MKRQWLSLLLVMVLVLQMPISAFASDRSVHSKQLEDIIFGRENYYASQPLNQKKAIEALECAAYLCPDQFNGSGANELIILKEYGVPGLPESVDVIDFKSNYSHRKYTHMGWVPVMHPEQGQWDIRKEILLSTVNKVFDFGAFTDVNIFGLKLAYTQQCDAFSALLYYIHILGDLVVLKDYAQYKKEGSYVLQLAQPHADANTPDILWDLMTTYLPNLFSPAVKESDDYKALMRRAESLARDARSLVGKTGGINDEDRFTEYKGYAMEFMKILKEYIPGLLKQETFFTSVFPPEG